MLLGAPKTARRNLTELRAVGVVLVLDDFGTGYSSLRDLPVAAVKIDRSFVGQLGTSAGDTAIVSAIVSLAARAGDRRDRRGRRARGAGGSGCASSAASSRRAICSAPPGPG